MVDGDEGGTTAGFCRTGDAERNFAYAERLFTEAARRLGAGRPEVSDFASSLAAAEWKIRLFDEMRSMLDASGPVPGSDPAGAPVPSGTAAGDPVRGDARGGPPCRSG